MIRFLSPGFAWTLAAPALILVLYMLRRRYLPRQIPSVFLWRKSVKDYAANRPFQRLMKNLLLPLQILAALILAIALMRPAIPGGTAGRTVLIFDISGSMQTETAGRSRLDSAKEEALALIRTLPAEEKITVLTAGEETERLALNAGREEAEKAVAAVTCGRNGADMDRALALADAVARDGETDTGASVAVYSDTFRRSQMTARGGAFTLSVYNCGAGEENRAVYSLEAAEGQAFARVANFGEDCSVSLTCEADGVCRFRLPRQSGNDIMILLYDESGRLDNRIPLGLYLEEIHYDWMAPSLTDVSLYIDRVMASVSISVSGWTYTIEFPYTI